MNTFGVISYGTASVTFLVLTVMLITSWRGRAQGARLIIASAMTSAWGAGMAWQAWQPGLPLIFVYTFEILRDGAWLVALVSLGRDTIPRVIAVGSGFLGIGLLAAAWALALLSGFSIVPFGPEFLFAPSGIAMALAVLVLLEQIYRNASATGRRGFTYLVIGLGGVFAYDLFLYSQASLLGGISADPWFARGLVTAMLVPLIAIAARRNPQWSLDVFVSRQAVMFTTAVIAIGLYLLVMALGGYYVREFGGTWGVTANILFFVGALAVLAVVVISGAVRRRLRVFLSKHFFRNKYDYRVEWLRFVETLSTADESDVRRTSLRAIAQIFDSPGGVMYVRDAAARQFVPAAAWPMRIEDLPQLKPIPLDHEMTRFVADRQWVIDLREYSLAPEVYQNVAVPDWLRNTGGIRLMAPLLQTRDLLGLVLLYEPPATFEPTYEDRDLLKTLGRHIATLVAQQEADRRLAESRQFEAYHRLTAFMMHDLKNAVAQLQLVVSNAERHKGNPAFIDDVIVTIGNAVERMNRLIEQLRDIGRPPVAGELDLMSVARGVVARCTDRLPAPAIGGDPDLPIRVCADAYRLSSSLEHVIRNAQDASGPDDRIELAISTADGEARIVIADTGGGMTPEFLRERLFRPFDSTKGSKGMGIGAYQVRDYVQSVGGVVEVHSNPGQGTRFEIRLPLAVSTGSTA